MQRFSLGGRFAILALAAIAGSASAGPGPKAGAADHGLVLTVTVPARFADPDHVKVTLTIKNVSAKPITLWSHVNAGETHLDWWSLQLLGKVPSVDAPHAPG